MRFLWTFSMVILLFIYGCSTSGGFIKNKSEKNELIQDNSLKIVELERKVKNIEKEISFIKDEIKNIKDNIKDLREADNKTQSEIILKFTNLYEQQQNLLLVLTNEVKNIKRELMMRNVSKRKVSKKPKNIKKTDKDFYLNCITYYKKKSYKECIKCFDKFISKYKKSFYIPNSYFWRGECYLNLGNFIKAIDNYDMVLTQYPDSEKVPSALLKEGIAFYYMKDKEGAKIFLQKVINEYPKSKQAQYAKKFLNKYLR